MASNEFEQLQREVQELRQMLSFVLSDRFDMNKNIKMQNGRNFIYSTDTGTKHGTGTDQKQGWYGATPVIQQTPTSQPPATFVANTSDIADDTATWGGYTVGDIVAILQAYGFLA